MSRNKLRAAWGLALAVLFGGAIARGEPPPVLPPAAVAEPFKVEPQLPPNPDSQAGPEHAHEAEGPGGDHGAFIVTGEYLLLRPMRQNTDYALVGTNPSWGPLGTIHNVDGGFDSGFRAGAGYQWCNGMEVLFGYTFFHANADDHVQAPAGGTVFPTLTHPAIVTAVDAAQARNSINLNLFDLELAHRWKVSDEVTLRAFAGPRLANLEQTMTATYTGREVGSDVVRRRMTFDGAGLRAGGEANWKFWEFLGVYFRGSASMLVGRTRSSLRETADHHALVDVSERYDKLVPIVDLGTGLSFQHHGWTIRAGYELINWFGVNDAIDFSDDSHPAKLNRKTGDLGFGGFVFQAEWRF